MRTAFLNLIFVGVGGFFGSIGRYVLSGAVYQIFPNLYFPIGTAVVNILGCLLIGFITGLAEVRNLLGPEMRVFLLIGLLGGFTTFSTFAIDTLQLADDNTTLFKAIAYILLSVLLCVLGAWAGLVTAKQMI